MVLVLVAAWVCPFASSDLEVECEREEVDGWRRGDLLFLREAERLTIGDATVVSESDSESGE